MKQYVYLKTFACANSTESRIVCNRPNNIVNTMHNKMHNKMIYLEIIYWTMYNKIIYFNALT